MNIGFIYNVKRKIVNKTEAEYDSLETIEGIKKALESGGHFIIPIEADDDICENIKKYKDKIDIVFNIAEGRRGLARESMIPAILDHYNIPYTGSDPLTLALTLNKAKTKEILSFYNIPTPEFIVVNNVNEIDLKKIKKISLPLIIKPVGEGSSVGIINKSVIRDYKTLLPIIKETLIKYNQPVLIEKFLEGQEFTVGILGNNPPEILPIIRIKFDFLPNSLEKIDSFEAKWYYDNPQNNVNPIECPANISIELEKFIKNISLKTYKILDCKDFARLDIRLDENNIPNVLEINALPGLIPDEKENSRFPAACRCLGMSYNEMILKILSTAIKRLAL